MKKATVFGFVLLVLIALQAGPHINSWLGREESVAGIAASMHTIQSNSAQLAQGDLLLVDQTHPVNASGVQQDIVDLNEHPELTQGYGLADASIKLSARVAEQWQKAVKAAAEDGVKHFVVNSGYRDEAAQAALYEEKGSDYALPPGKSEHNVGLSMDIGSTEQEMNQAPEGKWLSKHAWEYGFVLRYPKDKTDVTGIQFEPWHFRYVGLPHSVLMHKNDWTLEEYLAALKEKTTMTVDAGGATYEVVYYKASATGITPISVPVEGEYSVSGDNDGGLIVTIKQG